MSAPRDRDRDGGGTSLPPGTLLRAALEVLWNSSQSSIRDVINGLDNKLGAEVPYSTVASVLNKLCDTGFATRVRIPWAREYFYSALVSRGQLERTLTMEAVQTILAGARDSREALSYLLDIVGKADPRFLEGLGEMIGSRQPTVKVKRERAGSRSKKR